MDSRLGVPVHTTRDTRFTQDDDSVTITLSGRKRAARSIVS